MPVVTLNLIKSVQSIFCATLLGLTYNTYANDNFAIFVGQSFQGYSGLLNAPNASIVSHGSISLQYSDLVYYSEEYTHNNNLSTAIGVLPFFEIGGRISWFDTHSNCYTENCGLRDLSANIKVLLPYIPADLFSVAIGQQDVGGEANHFDARFIVASKEINQVRLSLGWGKQLADDSFNRLNGLFGGVEYQILPWLNMMIEHDGDALNVGARFKTPPNMLPYGASLASSLMLYQDSESSRSKNFYGISASIPLDFGAGQKRYKSGPGNLTADLQHTKPALSRAPGKSDDSPQQTAPSTTLYQVSPQRSDFTSLSNSSQNEHKLIILKLFNQLKETGFERVSVGETVSAGELVIALENMVFSRNDLDAFREVFRLFPSTLGAYYANVTIVLIKEGIPAFWLKASMPSASQIIAPAPNELMRIIESGYPNNLPDITWFHKDETLHYMKPRISLMPSLTSAVATEFGVWDYSLAGEIKTNLSLWKGAVFSTDYTHRLDQSEDFDPGSVFYLDRQISAFKSYGLTQFLKINSSFYTNFYIGLASYDYRSVVNESTLFTENGRHKLKFTYGLYENRYENVSNRDSYTASYRYYYPLLNFTSTFSAGKFWEEDTGYRIDLKFWFDDTAVDLFYKNTDAEFIGVGITIPLTPEKALNKPWWQLKGTNSWSYALQTRVGNTSNSLSFRSAILPPLPINMDKVLFNIDRLNSLYIKQNTARIEGNP